MEGKIPVPTGNIYKFYALFSLLIIVFSLGAMLYVNQSNNRMVMNAVVELETLKLDTYPSSAAKVKMAVLERQLELAKSDKQLYLISLSALLGLALYVGLYGFHKWHRHVQPLMDETARVQLEIARLQLEKLRTEAGEDQ
ncbi:MAG: hypothetical protein AAAB13_14870 [Pseudomonas sp.]